LTEEEFNAWFVGFTEAAGNFYIKTTNSKKTDSGTVDFNFRIKLHIDDRETLEIIQNRLGFGSISISQSDTVMITISKIEDLKKLIALFNKNPLMSTKSLDFKDFAKGFSLYFTYFNRSMPAEIYNQIYNLKLGMNDSRILSTNQINDLKDKVIITDYWLLGFTEGDGSFCTNKFKPVYSITQNLKNRFILEAIQNFLSNLRPQGFSLNEQVAIKGLTLNANIGDNARTNIAVLNISNFVPRRGAVVLFYFTFFPKP
jgi:hypothetical protein